MAPLLVASPFATSTPLLIMVLAATPVSAIQSPLPIYTSSCCFAHTSPGGPGSESACPEAACYKKVCGAHPWCCSPWNTTSHRYGAWNGICAAQARGLPLSQQQLSVLLPEQIDRIRNSTGACAVCDPSMLPSHPPSPPTQPRGSSSPPWLDSDPTPAVEWDSVRRQWVRTPGVVVRATVCLVPESSGDAATFIAAPHRSFSRSLASALHIWEHRLTEPHWLAGGCPCSTTECYDGCLPTCPAAGCPFGEGYNESSAKLFYSQYAILVGILGLESQPAWPGRTVQDVCDEDVINGTTLTPDTCQFCQGSPRLAALVSSSTGIRFSHASFHVTPRPPPLEGWDWAVVVFGVIMLSFNIAMLLAVFTPCSPYFCMRELHPVETLRSLIEQAVDETRSRPPDQHGHTRLWSVRRSYMRDSEGRRRTTIFSEPSRRRTRQIPYLAARIRALSRMEFSKSNSRPIERIRITLKKWCHKLQRFCRRRAQVQDETKTSKEPSSEEKELAALESVFRIVTVLCLADFPWLPFAYGMSFLHSAFCGSHDRKGHGEECAASLVAGGNQHSLRTVIDELSSRLQWFALASLLTAMWQSIPIPGSVGSTSLFPPDSPGQGGFTYWLIGMFLHCSPIHVHHIASTQQSDALVLDIEQGPRFTECEILLVTTNWISYFQGYSERRTMKCSDSIPRFLLAGFSLPSQSASYFSSGPSPASPCGRSIVPCGIFLNVR